MIAFPTVLLIPFIDKIHKLNRSSDTCCSLATRNCIATLIGTRHNYLDSYIDIFDIAQAFIGRTR